MKQALIRDGKVFVDDVPAPEVEAGTVLVRVSHSCISIGTEMANVRNSAMPLWKRALKQPENVKKVLTTVSTLGLLKTVNMVRGMLAAGMPTGYSAAGTVIDVGDGIDNIKCGDRVACAGAQCANHAEIIRVPRNLAVLIPNDLDFACASTVAVGSIALQGVRRANPTLGEVFVVIGLGAIGQITAQLLKTNGCRVICNDVDKTRANQTLELGMDAIVHPDDGDEIQKVMRLTDGVGADGVIITAAHSSDAIISKAFKMCRRKGRVVLIGDVGLNINRADIYNKELDFFISTSYGPGRYDNNYEEKGLDYPIGYVRWTENRNMAEYLRLVARGDLKIKPLIKAAIYPIDKATEAYEALNEKENKPLMAILSYPCDNVGDEPIRTIANPMATQCGKDVIKMAIVGAGMFAKGMHLPNLRSLSSHYSIHTIVSRSGHNASGTAKQFGAKYATTDFRKVLTDPDIDAVLIATRHNLHAGLTLDSLMAGKHTLVEKPLALSRAELDLIQKFYDSQPAGKNLPILLTGFNRRFSKYARRIHELIKDRTNPMIINYRMNAGYIPLDHWVHREEGGGRNIGEACHIYDLFTYLTNSKVMTIDAHSIDPRTNHYSSRDNFIATISFADGSVATLTYTALGNKDYPKEQMEVFVDGKVLFLDDYKRLNVTGTKASGIRGHTIDKGQKDELEVFADAIKKGGEWPIPLWQQLQAMEMSFIVEGKLAGGGLKA